MGIKGKEFRVIVLTHGGADDVLRALAELENVRVARVFIEDKPAPRRSFKEKLRRSLKYDGFWTTVGKTFRPSDTIESSPDATEPTARDLGIPVHFMSDLHDDASIESMRAAEPHLCVIYGTNIIKESVFSLPPHGSINLHQGLVPHYRGSACVFWALHNDEKEVGITVHRVAEKVDAGDVVLQKTIPLRYDFGRYGSDFERFIEDFRASIKAQCAGLIGESVRRIAEGTARFEPQDLTLGTRYKLPTKRDKDEMKKRLRERGRSLMPEVRRASSSAEVSDVE